MRITNPTKSLAAVFMAALLVLSAGAAAAATFDTETVSTATQSDVSGSTTTVNLHPGNTSESLYVETDGATTSNLTLTLQPEGVAYDAYTNSTPDTVNATAGHYAFNVTHDELADLPRDESGGTYTLTVENKTAVILNTTVVFETPTDNSAVLAITDQAGTDGAAMSNLVADRLTLSAVESGWFGISALSFGDDNGTEMATWSGYTAVNGTDSDLTVQLKNSSTADAYSAAAEDRDDGDWITGSTMWVNGVPHLVYLNEAPEDLDNDVTTVVYSESTDELQIDLNGEEYTDTRTVSLRATAGEGYAFGELWSNFGKTTAIKSLYN